MPGSKVVSRVGSRVHLASKHRLLENRSQLRLRNEPQGRVGEGRDQKTVCVELILGNGIIR